MEDLLEGISIFLIGMMGTGKTTVGEQLARQLNYRFFDTDVLIERVSGKTINQIFAEEGENNFRILETKVIAELSACTRSAIATGGGVVIKQENWSYLSNGLIVWLDAPPELLLARLADDNTRPLLKDPDPAQKLKSLLNSRRSLYARADLHIEIEPHHTPTQIASQIVDRIPSVLKNKSTLPEFN
ncbi:MAG: shikimate kinase [Prochloraceae cyanobacterium]|nr:shikimate kinase [Prochloraceae cyanobacterium]